MNTAIRCIILLACTTICVSKPILQILMCRCVKTSMAVRRSLIHHAEVHEPRPYCNKKEIIVVLNDKRSLCLNPNGLFAKRVLPQILMERAFLADEKKTKNTTSASATTWATAAPTSST